MNSTIAIKKTTVNEKITGAKEKFTNNSGQNYRYLHFNLGLMTYLGTPNIPSL